MAKLTKAQVAKAIEALSEEYPEAGCELDHGSTFQLLVSVVLSAQTTDVSVNKVTPALFAKAPDAFAMAAMPAIQKRSSKIGLRMAYPPHCVA